MAPRLRVLCLAFLLSSLYLLHAQESPNKDQPGRINTGSRVKKSPGQSPVSVYLQFIPTATSAANFDTVKDIINNQVLPSLDPDVEITSIKTTTECTKWQSAVQCTCVPGYLFDKTKCLSYPSCSISPDNPSNCKCTTWTTSMVAYCEQPPQNPGRMSLLSDKDSDRGTIQLLFSSTQEVTDISWYLINFFGNPTKELHNGTKVSVVTSRVDSLLTVTDIPRDWAGKYVCRFMHKNFQWQVSDIIRLPLHQEDITRKPTQVSIINRSMGFSAVTLQCCIFDDGQSYSVFWEPGRAPSVAQKANGQLCYSFTITSLPETDTKCKCVFQDNRNQFAEAEINVMVIQATDIFCPDDVFDNNWKATKAGQVAEILCPMGKQGILTRRCNTDGRWGEIQSGCLDIQLLSTLEQAKWLHAGLGIPEMEIPWIIAMLRNNTLLQEKYISDSGDIIMVVETIKIISQTAMDNNVHINSSTMQDFVASCSQILDMGPLWSGALHNNPSIGATLMYSIENMTRLLEPNGESFSLILPNIELSVNVLNPLNVMDYNRTFNSTPKVELFMYGNMLEELVKQSNLTVTSMVLNNLARILPLHFGEDIEGSEHMMKNPILINTVMSNNGSVTNASVDMIFWNGNDTISGFSQCVYWDYSSFEGVGGWSTEGCHSFSIGNGTVCTCKHLTSFSVLMSIASILTDFSLELLSQFGVVCSIISLIICLIIYIVEWKSVVKNKISFFRQTSMINIALSLLIADSWFLASSFFNKRHTNKLCIAAAFFNHLFYLATFFWMLSQGLILFHQIVFVFHQLRKRTVVPIMAAIGYICPLLISLVTLAIYYPRRTYIKEGACFLNGQNGAIYAFSVPVLIIIVVNTVILVVVIFKLLRPSLSEGPEGEDKKALIAILKALLILTPVFGLTWVIGIATLIREVHKFFHYVFNLLNSFQMTPPLRSVDVVLLYQP
ncbi:adhesion G-protein coupled receptor F3-like [Discoglossus pictus]